MTDNPFSKPTISRELLLNRTDNRPNREFFDEIAAYITIHETANPRESADAEMHARWMRNPKCKPSWHATVDEDSITQSMEWTEQAWHAGTGYGQRGNVDSIAIELCVNEGSDFYATLRRTAELVRYLRSLGHGEKGVVQHNNWSGKECPRLLRREPELWAALLDLIDGGTLDSKRTRLSLDGVRRVVLDDDIDDANERYFLEPLQVHQARPLPFVPPEPMEPARPKVGFGETPVAKKSAVKVAVSHAGQKGLVETGTGLVGIGALLPLLDAVSPLDIENLWDVISEGASPEVILGAGSVVVAQIAYRLVRDYLLPKLSEWGKGRTG